jgi:hypothetical protein
MNKCNELGICQSIGCGECCKKCHGEMKPSKAIVTRASGIGDFGKHDVVTMSPDPRQPILVDCMKCSKCGYSVSEPK